jgi:hypothetical protein
MAEGRRGKGLTVWTGTTVRATGGGACPGAMLAEAASGTDAAVAAAVVAETAAAVEIAAERKGRKDRLKTWYGSERPCVGERNWGGGEEDKEGKKNGRRR